MKDYQITSHGLFANQILSEAQVASVIGITSRGIYLKINQRGIIFISYEIVPGPLVLNLEGDPILFKNINKHSPVEVDQKKILFPDEGILINTYGSKIWRSRPCCDLPQDRYGRDMKVTAIARELLNKRRDAGFTHLLGDLLKLNCTSGFSQQPIFGKIDIRRIFDLVHQKEVSAILSGLNNLLSLGFGLTPSGDDLIIGLLLSFNRYRRTLNPPFDISRVNASIKETAYKKTSLLSANLIECASKGEADEPLILALDGIIGGKMDTAKCTDLLLNWGNSSGGDAFLGIALAVYNN